MYTTISSSSPRQTCKGTAPLTRIGLFLKPWIDATSLSWDSSKPMLLKAAYITISILSTKKITTIAFTTMGLFPLSGCRSISWSGNYTCQFPIFGLLYELMDMILWAWLFLFFFCWKFPILLWYIQSCESLRWVSCHPPDFIGIVFAWFLRQLDFTFWALSLFVKKRRNKDISC